jgi:hypothetical protein
LASRFAQRPGTDVKRFFKKKIISPKNLRSFWFSIL